MAAFLTAVNAVLPVFLLIALGAYAARVFPSLDVGTFTKYNMYFGIPAVVFVAVSQAEISMQQVSRLSGGYLLYVLILGVLVWLLTRDLPSLKARGVLVATLFGNSGNMGLPIALFAYGQAGLERAMVLFVLSLVMMYVAAPTFLAGQGSIKDNFFKALKLPTIGATALGLMFNFANVELPISIERALKMLSDTCLPLMQFSLGLQIYRSWVWAVDWVAVRASALRLVLGSGVTYAVCAMLGLTGLDLGVMMLGAVMPAAITMFVVAVEVKGDVDGIARTVMLTTVLSIFFITLSIWLFPA